MTIKELIKVGMNKLNSNDENETRNRLKILLAFLLKKETSYLAIHSNEEIEESVENNYFDAIERINDGTPLQYITNEQYFMGMKFYVDENVLIPRQDTEVLVEEVLELVKQKEKCSILDICTGSGAIAISVKNLSKNTSVTATDISKNALNVAQKNAVNLNSNIKLIESDLFENIEEKYDIIVSNPPYIRTEVINKLEKEVQNEPKIALDGGTDGLYFYKKIAKQAKEHLNPNGYIAFEIGFDQKEDLIKILQQEEYKNIYSKKDYAGNDRIVIGKK